MEYEIFKQNWLKMEILTGELKNIPLTQQKNMKHTLIGIIHLSLNSK